MYRPSAYAIDEPEVLHRVIRERRFATIASIVNGRLQFAYAPVIVDSGCGPRGAVRFHLARVNPLADAEAAEMRFSFLAADAYVSPDWYHSRGFVPTWNYIAVEGAGTARPLDDAGLRKLLVDLSASEEEKLRPKPPWTLDKIPEARMTALLNAIRGFSVRFDTLEGKFKLSQDKKPGDIAAVIAGLEARGDPASRAVARAMKAHRGTAVRASTSSA
jgi:transcriptional regulator